MAKLYQKPPLELRVQLGHLSADASLENLLNMLCTVRYQAHCVQDKMVQFDPMELDNHVCEYCDPWAIDAV